MIWELIYTSLEHGLFSDGSGFGVAAATSGIPGAVSDILSAGSGYDALFPPHSPEYSMNPVADFHYTVTLGNASYHWVGRITAAGVDYSGRSNMLAHHLLVHEQATGDSLPENLLDECGKAGIIEPYGFDGRAKWLKPVPKLPVSAVRPPSRAVLWEKYFGDSGWAGILARQVVNKSAPVYIVFKKGWDVKGLLDEAISLLPPAMHWQVTYNTYFSTVAGGIGCDWRFCYEGSPLLDNVRRKNVNIIIDGTMPPPDDSWCAFARGDEPSPLSGKDRNIISVLLPESKEQAPETATAKTAAPVVFSSSAGIRLVAVKPKTAKEASFTLGRYRDYLLPVVLLLIACAGILWMFFSSSGGSELPEREVVPAVPERKTAVNVVKRRLRQQETPRKSVPVEEESPLINNAAANAGTAKSASERGQKSDKKTIQEPVPVAVSVPRPLNIHPDELKDLAQQITIKALCGVPGTAEMKIELPSPLRPEVQPAAGSIIEETEDGFAVAGPRGGLCRFSASSDTGNWQMVIEQNFLPGVEGFVVLRWSAGDSVKAAEMRFDDRIAVLQGQPGWYEDNGQYYRTITFVHSDNLLWERLAGLQLIDDYIWDHNTAQLGMPLTDYNADVAVWLQAADSEIANLQAEYDAEIQRNRTELQKWQIAGENFLRERNDGYEALEKNAPRMPPPLKDRDDYSKAYSQYLKANGKWLKKLDSMRKDTAGEYSRIYQKEINAYSAEIERLLLLREQIQLSDQLLQKKQELQQEFDEIIEEWTSRRKIEISLGGNSRFVEIVFPERDFAEAVR